MNNVYNFNNFMKKCNCKSNENNQDFNFKAKINFPCDNNLTIQGSGSIDSSITKKQRFSKYINFHCYKKNINDPYAYLDNRGLIYKPYVSVIQKTNVTIQPLEITAKFSLQELNRIKTQTFTSAIQ